MSCLTIHHNDKFLLYEVVLQRTREFLLVLTNGRKNKREHRDKIAESYVRYGAPRMASFSLERRIQSPFFGDSLSVISLVDVTAKACEFFISSNCQAKWDLVNKTLHGVVNKTF